MTNVKFEIDGIDLLQAYYRKVAAGANMHQLFEPVTKEFEKVQREWFSSQGQGSWAPLSPSYGAWKSVHAPGQPLLVLTGKLRDSKFSAQETSDTLAFTVNAPFYWFYHQFGTSKMPARPPYVVDLELDNKLADTFKKSFLDYFRKL